MANAADKSSDRLSALALSAQQGDEAVVDDGVLPIVVVEADLVLDHFSKLSTAEIVLDIDFDFHHLPPSAFFIDV